MEVAESLVELAIAEAPMRLRGELVDGGGERHGESESTGVEIPGSVPVGQRSPFRKRQPAVGQRLRCCPSFLACFATDAALYEIRHASAIAEELALYALSQGSGEAAGVVGGGSSIDLIWLDVAALVVRHAGRAGAGRS